MELIKFKDLPSTDTPINAENLNHNFNYLAEKNYIVAILYTIFFIFVLHPFIKRFIYRGEL